ncbi:MAG: MarR family winged helix-turn-helix transcriptional regulator [Marmoricola sp.]
MQESDALVDALAQTSFATTTALTALAAEFELTLPQMRVLGVLRGRRVRMSDLASYLDLEKSSLSGLVERAERTGLVARERSATDARSVEVFLTAQGNKVADRATKRSRDLVIPLVGNLSKTEQNQLQALLEKALDARRSI